MPMPFQKAVTTEKGVELLNRSQAGEGVITFVAIATGNGVYSELEKRPENLRKSINLKASKNFYKISEVRKENSNSIKVTAVIGNQDPVTKEAVVTEGYRAFCQNRRRFRKHSIKCCGNWWRTRRFLACFYRKRNCSDNTELYCIN